jgi:hypothetical protein
MACPKLLLAKASKGKAHVENLATAFMAFSE